MVLSPQVDLGFLRFVSAIGTQGAISQETKKKYYVKSYKVDVSSNGEDWITIKDGPKQKVTCFIIFMLFYKSAVHPIVRKTG